MKSNKDGSGSLPQRWRPRSCGGQSPGWIRKPPGPPAPGPASPRTRPAASACSAAPFPAVRRSKIITFTMLYILKRIFLPAYISPCGYGYTSVGFMLQNNGLRKMCTFLLIKFPSSVIHNTCNYKVKSYLVREKIYKYIYIRKFSFTWPASLLVYFKSRELPSLLPKNR